VLQQDRRQAYKKASDFDANEVEVAVKQAHAAGTAEAEHAGLKVFLKARSKPLGGKKRSLLTVATILVSSLQA
jgi:hypothetical protein